MSTNFLLKVADVLDAIADEKSELEAQISTLKHAHRQEKLSPIVEKLSFITGDDPDELSNKLSSVDDTVLSMLSGLAGTETSSLGGPGTAKTAGVEGGVSGSDRAERDFANWILS